MKSYIHKKGILRNISSHLNVLSALLSFIVALVCGIWIVQDKIMSFDKRITLCENNFNVLAQKITEQKDAIEQDNDAQDKQFLRFQDNINQRLVGIEEKINKIYVILSEK